MYTQADFERQYRAAHEEAFNRTLRMQHQNRAQARLLHMSNSKTERDHQREVKAGSLQKEAILREQEQRAKLTPSIDQWMRKRASHVRSFQDRERERIMSRHSRSAQAAHRPRAFSEAEASYLAPREQAAWSRAPTVRERGKSAVTRAPATEAPRQRHASTSSLKGTPSLSLSRTHVDLGAWK